MLVTDFGHVVRATKQTHYLLINVEMLLIINNHQLCFSVDICLKMKVDPMYVYRRCFNFEMRLPLQRQYMVIIKVIITIMRYQQNCF